MATQAINFDHYELSAAENPFREFNSLRDSCPVAHTDAHGGIWVLSRYADVCAAARDPQHFSSEADGVSIPHHGLPFRVPPIELDPPLHIVYRRSLTSFFTSQTVARHEQLLRGIVTTLIDAFIERGDADFAQELTIPYPSRYAVGLLGLPQEDTDRVVGWAKRIMSATGDQDVAIESATYFNELLEARRREPRDDIPGTLAKLEINGEPIDPVSFIATMSTLYAAGLDTTANAGALIIELLSHRTDIRAALIEDFARIPGAVEEFLRYTTPLPALHRTATEELTVHGQAIAAGERVQLNFLCANHDPERWSEPEAVDIERDAGGQVAFGDGPHKCLGQHLARLELKLLLEEVLTRIPDFKPADAPVQRYKAITRGISSLPMVFTPGSRS